MQMLGFLCRQIILTNRKHCEFFDPQDLRRLNAKPRRQVQWLKPDQPAEIEFVERTPHGRLRHASFRRLLPRSGEK
jgi:ATP-dependent DNA ligase